MESKLRKNSKDAVIVIKDSDLKKTDPSNCIVGIITTTDLFKKVYIDGISFPETAGELMRNPLIYGNVNISLIK